MFFGVAFWELHFFLLTHPLNTSFVLSLLFFPSWSTFPLAHVPSHLCQLTSSSKPPLESSFTCCNPSCPKLAAAPPCPQCCSWPAAPITTGHCRDQTCAVSAAWISSQELQVYLEGWKEVPSAFLKGCMDGGLWKQVYGSPFQLSTSSTHSRESFHVGISGGKATPQTLTLGIVQR